MFFFIIGARPRKQTVEAPQTQTLLCSSCGGAQVFVEHAVRNYLEVFFIPILPLGGGKRVFVCQSCGLQVAGDRTTAPYSARKERLAPEYLGTDAARDYLHCVHCGNRVPTLHRSGSQKLECPVCKESFEVRL